MITDLGSSANASVLAIQPDGKIIVAGSTGGGADFALARYLVKCPQRQASTIRSGMIRSSERQVGLAKVIANAEQRLSGQPGGGIGQAIPKVQRG